MKKRILLVTIFLCMLALAAALRFYVFCTNPHVSAREPVRLEVPGGSSLKYIAGKLHEQDVITAELPFRLLARLSRTDHAVKSGDYEFSGPMSPLAVLERLTRGEVLLHSFTVPEGSTIFEVARIIAAAGFSSEAQLLARATDPVFVRQMGITGDSLEGFLFPDTYLFSRDVTAATILDRMVARYRDVYAEERTKTDLPPGLNERELITLASLVEAETAHPDERALIAAVFLRRLKKRMRLECDPTVVYGQLRIDPKFTGRLRKKHLRQETPYNTYRNFGLPPGPICNPGREAIRAVLNPADADFLYFVSRNDGTHQFSRTFKEHNRAVEQYQKRRRTPTKPAAKPVSTRS